MGEPTTAQLGRRGAVTRMPGFYPLFNKGRGHGHLEAHYQVYVTPRITTWRVRHDRQSGVPLGLTSSSRSAGGHGASEGLPESPVATLRFES